MQPGPALLCAALLRRLAAGQDRTEAFHLSGVSLRSSTYQGAPTLKLHMRPAIIVDDMKLLASHRGGVGVRIESGTVALFTNLRIVPARYFA